MILFILNRFKKIYANYNKVISNFMSLSILQGLNYILPLLTLPYLIQVLGVEKFGLVAFATSFSLYFSIISDYGYKLTAPRDIAKCDQGDEAVNKITNVVFISKILLLLICYLVLLIVGNLFSPFKEHLLLFNLAFLAVCAQSLIPVWFFQGKEDMKYVTYINILSKLLFLILIFIYVSSPSDYFLVPAFNAVGFLVAAILAMYKIKEKYNYKFILPTTIEIRNSFKDGWEVFLGSAFSSLYTNSNIVLLGLFSSPTTVGVFSIADKIVSAISGLFIPLNQALFPFLSKQFKVNKSIFYSIVRKLRNILFMISVLLFVLFLFGMDIVIQFVTNDTNSAVLLLTMLMSIRIISSPFSNLYSNALIISGKKSEYLKVMKYTVVVNVLIVYPMIYLYEAIGLAVGFVIVLWFHTVLLYLNNRKDSYEQY